MIRWARSLFLFVLAIALLTLAGANRVPVTLSLLPPEMDRFLGLGLRLDLPLFLIIFAAMLAGLALGFVWEWLRGARHRTDAKVSKRQVSQLEREMARVTGQKGGKEDDVLALLDGKGKTG